MTDERRAYTRVGQRARAKERASRARAHTLRISRAQLPCLVAQQLCWVSAASGPWASCRSAHYTVSFVAGQRLPRGAHKALTGCMRKKQRVGFDRSARNGVSARRVGRPAEGRCRCTTPRTPGGLLVRWRRGGCLLRRSRASPSLASHVRLDPLDPLDPPPAHLSPLRSRSNGIRTPNLAFAHPKT
jgi:hypothetical protein